jgi:hypothetical protein
MANADTSSSTPTVAEKFITAAVSQLGVPYVWGGTTPKGHAQEGFDCAGLTQYCAAEAGVSIPRTSQEQWATLEHVVYRAAPGDLVFFKGALAPGEESPGHVGIVTKVDDKGNATQMIDAPFTGTVVRYDFVSPGTAYGIVGYALLPSPVTTPPADEKPEEATTAPAETTPETAPHYSGTCLIGLPVLRVGDYGPAVRVLCILWDQVSTGLGENINLGIPSSEDFASDEGVKHYQQIFGLTVDGIVGVQTWTSLLTGEKVSV